MKNEHEEKSLAMEICEELKTQATRWKLAFFSVAVIEVLTVIALVFAVK